MAVQGVEEAVEKYPLLGPVYVDYHKPRTYAGDYVLVSQTEGLEGRGHVLFEESAAETGLLAVGYAVETGRLAAHEAARIEVGGREAVAFKGIVTRVYAYLRLGNGPELLEVAAQHRDFGHIAAVEVQTAYDFLAQHLLHGRIDGLEDYAVILELDFGLGRGNVDVDAVGIHFQEEEVLGVHTLGHEVLVGLEHCLVQVRAAEIASVHEEILVAAAFPGTFRLSYEAAYAGADRLGGEFHQILGHIPAQEALDAELETLVLLQ